jgi:type II secretory pathway pseudopilin PulG
VWQLLLRLERRHLMTSIAKSKRRSAQSGYALLAILVMVTLLMIATLSTAPALRTQVRRNQEIEMIHRGVQYSRAIKRYFAKFGRYPTSLEQLENTDNIRFLRKEYKDPMIADGQWRLLHWGDVVMNFNNLATPAATAANRGSRTVTQVEGEVVLWANSSGSSAGSPGTSSGAAATSTSGGGLDEGTASNAPAATQTSTANSSTNNSTIRTINSGAIIGVVSNSLKEGLHAFNGKTQYSEWYFVYDPSLDNGALITQPYSGRTSYNHTGVTAQGTANNIQQPLDPAVSSASGEQSEAPPQ